MQSIITQKEARFREEIGNWAVAIALACALLVCALDYFDVLFK